MLQKMCGASALLIDILENAISILNNARKKKEGSRMKPNSFIRENGNSLIRLHQSDIIISQFKIKNIREYLAHQIVFNFLLSFRREF